MHGGLNPFRTICEARVSTLVRWKLEADPVSLLVVSKAFFASNCFRPDGLDLLAYADPNRSGRL
jgi:hypothetical protein